MSDINQLILLKKKIIYPLLLIVIVAYFSFIAGIAYYPDVLANKILDTQITFGIIIGFVLILLIFLITLIYVYLSNKYIESFIREIKR